MIYEPWLTMIFGTIDILISLIPTFTFTIPTGVMTGLTDLISGVGYVLPVAGLLPILYMSFALTYFRTMLSIIVRVKSFIPLMGGA